MIIRQAPMAHWSYLVARVGCAPTSAFKALEAVYETEGAAVVVGMIGFDTWWGNAAQIHFAFDKPIAFRKLAREALSFIFSHRDVLVGWVPSSKTEILGYARRLGFRELCRVADGWARGDDMVMLSLRKQDCPAKWLKEV